MLNRLKLSGILLIALLLAACNSTMDEERDTWVGRTEAELIAEKGQPNRVLPNRRGGVILQYIRSDVTGSTAGGFGSAGGGNAGEGVATYSAGSVTTTQRFTAYYVDEKGVITKITSKMM
ncbi:hypothetical protein PN836_013665 [Ningiella sp. W23]|uniref:hypothetical protein n=1 Tax=Ningiella sp. W23 TaxID=3023715 RepID=UPI003756A93B